ncbi:MAG TPA: ABC transporter permease [Acidimicrobiales bacterium]|nr:ABC transporter permease [Acidimicrobiales bacterium]
MNTTALWRTTATELKLFLREPAGVFFTLAFPILLLMLNGEGGNRPMAEYGGEGKMNVLVPGLLALVMATMSVMGLPEGLARYREWGVLRRLRATPVGPGVVLGAQVVVASAVSVAGALLLVGVALAGFGLDLPASPVAVATTFALGTVALLSLAFLLASLPLPARSTQALASIVFFPMIFVSGATWPRDQLPDIARTIGDFVPLTYAVDGLGQAWTAGTWDLGALAVLAGTAVASAVAATRLFRWE